MFFFFSQGRSAVVDEFEKLKNAYSVLEKRNLKLESENLDLHIKMEKEKSAVKRLTEKNGELEKMLIVADEVRFFLKHKSPHFKDFSNP